MKDKNDKKSFWQNFKTFLGLNKKKEEQPTIQNSTPIEPTNEKNTLIEEFKPEPKEVNEEKPLDFPNSQSTNSYAIDGLRGENEDSIQIDTGVAIGDEPVPIVDENKPLDFPSEPEEEIQKAVVTPIEPTTPLDFPNTNGEFKPNYKPNVNQSLSFPDSTNVKSNLNAPSNSGNLDFPNESDGDFNKTVPGNTNAPLDFPNSLNVTDTDNKPSNDNDEPLDFPNSNPNGPRF